MIRKSGFDFDLIPRFCLRESSQRQLLEISTYYAVQVLSRARSIEEVEFVFL